MEVNVCNRTILQISKLAPRTAVLSMYDNYNPVPVVGDKENCLEHLALICHDLTEPMEPSVLPNREIARQILNFCRKHLKDASTLLFQCENSYGLSQAGAAGVKMVFGADPRYWLRRGVYNRLLYQLIVEEGGKTLPPEPCVSIMVRVTYPLDRLQTFLSNIRRQRYTNWQVVVVTDGPRPDIRDYVQAQTESAPDSQGMQRIKLLETESLRGLWGHPLRQVGIDNCDGTIIGLQNDDNYLTPGYMEQLVWALEDGADIALCDCVHSYLAWGYEESQARTAKGDMGCWLARADLVRKVRWPGNHAFADGDFIQAMAQLSGPNRIAKVSKPLFIHN
jgi:Glycosyl transferase family 2